MWVGLKLKLELCESTGETNVILGIFKREPVSRTWGLLLSYQVTPGMVRSDLGATFKKDVNELESIQRMTTRRIEDPTSLPGKSWLKEIRLLTWKRRKAWHVKITILMSEGLSCF